MTYTAKITKLTNFRKHPNADRLYIAEASNCTVIVGDKSKNGDLGIFFPAGGQLNREYATHNNLIRGKDEHGNSTGGFFEENRRVRPLTLRGVKSEGYWAPLESLSYIQGYQKLSDGDEINELNGHKICKKYHTKATRERLDKQKKNKRPNAILGLSRHWDTPNIKQKINLVQNLPGTIVAITEKLHGTSGRTGYALVKRKPHREEMSIWEKVKSLFGKEPLEIEEWKLTHGSRNVILNADNNDHTFRFRLGQQFEGKLHKGETIFYEIVGYDDNLKSIMEKQDTSKIRDRALAKKYGLNMTYSYGCTPEKDVVNNEYPNSHIFVYRISRTSPDGSELDMPWSQVKARCSELGVEHVPEFEHISWDCTDVTVQSVIEHLVDKFIDGPSTLDSSHIREGVCVRVEPPNSTKPYILKAKSWTFGCLEGYLKDNPEFVDREDIS